MTPGQEQPETEFLQIRGGHAGFQPSTIVSGRFRIVRFIAHGGMGEVYEAEDLHLGTRIALKTIRPDIASDQRIVDRFKREIRLAMTVTHPNVCRVHDLGHHDDGTMFLTMQLLLGETLADRIQRSRMTTAEALPVVRQMTAALDAAHKAGIVHRDFKSANVILVLTQDGRATQAVVTDFGIAHSILTDGAEAGTLAQTGEIVGTPAYLAPEQLTAGPITPGADIYALGVVIYEMVTGVLPFVGGTPLQIALKRLSERPTPPRSHVPDLDPAWETVILRCLERSPTARFAAAGDVATALTGSKIIDTPNTVRLLRRPVLVGLAVLAAIASAPWLWFRSRRPAIDSLAILPFATTALDPSLGYLGEGIAEGLINNVSQLPELTVISRSSAFRHPPDADPQLVGRKLNVRAVLTGHITKQGDELSIGVELVDVSNNRHLWGKTYRRTKATLAAAPNEIAREISDELRLSLSPENRHRLTQSSTGNPEAYQSYIKGRYYWNKRTPDGFRQAIEQFQKAIDLDPTFAFAYAGLADCYMFLDTPPKERFPRAKAAAHKALELDDRLAMAFATIGYIEFLFEWRWRESEAAFKRAIDLNPGYATAHSMYARYLTAMGRFDEAIAQARRALELDPLSLGVSTGLGTTYYLAGRLDLAIEQYRKTLDTSPQAPLVSVALAMSLMQKSRLKDAILILQPLADSGKNDEALIYLGCAYARLGRRAEAARVLDEVNAVSRRSYVSPYYIAYLHTALGNKGQAFDQLDKAYNERAPNLPALKVQPEFDDLRSDPRFAALLRRVGLT